MQHARARRRELAARQRQKRTRADGPAVVVSLPGASGSYEERRRSTEQVFDGRLPVPGKVRRVDSARTQSPILRALPVPDEAEALEPEEDDDDLFREEDPDAPTTTPGVTVGASAVVTDTGLGAAASALMSFSSKPASHSNGTAHARSDRPGRVRRKPASKPAAVSPASASVLESALSALTSSARPTVDIMDHDDADGSRPTSTGRRPRARRTGSLQSVLDEPSVRRGRKRAPARARTGNANLGTAERDHKRGRPSDSSSR
jgi:hypothetical protein